MIRFFSNVRDEKKFCKAIRSNNLKKVKKLLAAGYDPNVPYYDEYPLFLAFNCIDNDILETLLAHPNIDLGIVDNEGRTLLHFAAASLNYDLLYELLDKHEFDINMEPSVLSYVIGLKEYEMAENLIIAGAKADLTDLYCINDAKIFQMALQHQKEELSKKEIYQLMVYLEDEYADFITLLFQKYPKKVKKAINYKDGYLLHDACDKKKVDILLGAGANSNMIRRGNPPLISIYKKTGNYDIVKSLLANGADPSVKGEGNLTIRDIALNNNDVGMITILDDHDRLNNETSII